MAGTRDVTDWGPGAADACLAGGAAAVASNGIWIRADGSVAVATGNRSSAPNVTDSHNERVAADARRATATAPNPRIRITVARISSGNSVMTWPSHDGCGRFRPAGARARRHSRPPGAGAPSRARPASL